MILKENELQKLQSKEYIILKELKRICKKHNITYFLAYGSMIGAIRHKGFIPWDDDIDVCMHYNDYIRFEEACKTDLGQDFFLQTRYTEPTAGLSYDKLRLNGTTLIIDYMESKDIHHGINIDVYPLYNVPDNVLLRRLQLIAAALYMLLESGNTPKNHGVLFRTVSIATLFLFKGKSRKKLKDACHSYMARYEGKNTKEVAMLFGNMDICNHRYPSECFEKAIDTMFEDDFFYIPVGYDKILSCFYGDYMKLPPLEKRGAKTEHIRVMDTENPYTIYR